MPTVSRRKLLASVAAGGLALSTPSFALAGPGKGRGKKNQSNLSAQDRETLMAWARDTWTGIEAMVDPSTGLIADNIDADLSTRSGYTSPTNIGGLLWSILIARELGFLTPGHARNRIATTLRTLSTMDRHEPSGMFYNWYSEADGSVLRVWPDEGNAVVPFVSSVDMGWLGAALYLVIQADPSNRKAARALFDSMRWDVFFDKEFTRHPGANVGGFWVEDPSKPEAQLMDLLNEVGGNKVWYHITHHYDTAISEARMVTYLGLLTGQIPAGAYFATYRSFPPDWTWPEMPATGEWKNYEGVEVFEGAHDYRGMRIVPGWGGSMFEELMPDLFVPEAEWAPLSWGKNHRLHVRAQREHGLDEAGYGYWGFSPASNPYGGYREYGVDALGLNPDGYFSDVEQTNWKSGQESQEFGEGIVTPHASALAMQYELSNSIDNLAALKRDFDCYGKGGFFDSIAVDSGTVARQYLSLDQCMFFGAVGNVLTGSIMHTWFATPDAQRRIRPVIAQEEFNVSE